MCRALDVAKYIIKTCEVDNLKLQKLLYYSQAVHLVLHNNQALFNDVIEAWQYGPVVPVAYKKYKKFGFDILKDDANIRLKKEEIASIDIVIQFYGKMSAIELVTRTHQEAPWLDVYNPKKKNVPISTQSIYDYFKDRLEFSE